MDVPKPGNARSARHIAIARDLVDRLPDGDIVAVLLSGSSTWGDADASSDIDFQILVDRDPPYREVTCVRIADLLGHAVPDGPRYVDLDRISARYYQTITVTNGGWHHRVVHGLILRDTDGFLANLQRTVIGDFVRPASYRARFEKFCAAIASERAGARAAEATGDPALARLRGRQMVAHAVSAILDFADDRVSNHLVKAGAQAVSRLGRPDLATPIVRGLAVDGNGEDVARTLGAWRRFGEVSRDWLADPAIGGRLNGEDRAWALFNWSEQIVEEIEYRRDALTGAGDIAALQHRAYELLTTPVRISFGKYLSLIERGQVARLDVAEFHAALRRLHSELFRAWVEGLRLDATEPSLADREALVDELLALGRRELATFGG